MAIPTVALNSWEDFLKLTMELSSGSPASFSWLARGEADASWKLIPSLRRFAPRDLSHSEFITLEETLLSEFLAQAHLHIPPEILGSRQNRLQKLAIMQHYGVPTRLLDWTESLFVAAYFAVEQCWEKAGSIWYAHRRTLVQQMENRHEVLQGGNFAVVLLAPNAPMAIMPLTPYLKIDRMVAQQGVFTVAVNPLVDYEVVLSSLEPKRKDIVGKIIIPRELKPTFLRNLRAMNITANALFPGLDGLGRSLKELVRLAPHYPKDN